MILEEFVESGVRVIFAYMPVWEMFFSMHVIAGPEHHLERERWLRNLEEEQGELTGRIRELGGSDRRVESGDRFGFLAPNEIDGNSGSIVLSAKDEYYSVERDGETSEQSIVGGGAG